MVFPPQGMFQALTEIGQKHGLVGLWRGAVGGLPRVVIGSSTQLCTFSSTKDLLSQWEIFPPQSWKVALAAAMVSGVAVVLAMTPFDVASTRLYNQPTDTKGKVRKSCRVQADKERWGWRSTFSNAAWKGV